VGPDGNIWFTEIGGNKIGRISPAGVITEFSNGLAAGSIPGGITAGPDGALWFTEIAGNNIGRITTSGVITNQFSIPTPNAAVHEITTGPDGNLWFAEAATDKIARMTPSGVVTEFSLQTSGNAPFDIVSRNRHDVAQRQHRRRSGLRHQQ
jgi:virginiamycin B lyase